MAVLPRLAEDVGRLVALPAEKQMALAETLSEFKPDASQGILPEEVRLLKERAGVPEEAVFSAIRVLTLMQSSEELRTPEGLLVGMGAPSKITTQQAELLLQTFLAAATRLSQRLELLEMLASAMVTFQHCQIACSLRLIGHFGGHAHSLVPVATVRIVLDEGDDRVFQCTASNLLRLREEVERALGELASLQTVASSLAQQEKQGG